jgi:hypothetical protein
MLCGRLRGPSRYGWNSKSVSGARAARVRVAVAVSSMIFKVEQGRLNHPSL